MHPIDVAAARRVPLTAVLKRMQAAQDKYEKAKWRTSAGIISVTGSKFFNWNRCIGGAGAIDLVMHLQSCHFKAALLWLSNQFGAFASHPEGAAQCCQPVLRLPKRDDSKLSRIINYLSGPRSIHPDVIRFLIGSQTLYADARANAVFLLLGKEKMPVGAELRGTTEHWHGMARGSSKDRGYFSIETHHCKRVILCESAIDAISCFLLHPDSLAISAAGAHPNPAWLKSLIALEQQVFCGYDSDEVGEAMADKMIRLHPKIQRLRPSQHDWNDVLAGRSPELNQITPTLPDPTVASFS